MEELEVFSIFWEMHFAKINHDHVQVSELYFQAKTFKQIQPSAWHFYTLVVYHQSQTNRIEHHNCISTDQTNRTLDHVHIQQMQSGKHLRSDFNNGTQPQILKVLDW